MATQADFVTQRIAIPAGTADVCGELVLPEGANGLVLLVAHNSQRTVAQGLNAAGFGTLQLVLLSSEEQSVERVASRLRYEVPVLANRLACVTDWLLNEPTVADLRRGYLGEATDAAVALWAAAERPYAIDAIVTLNGRMEFAGPALPCVRAPTLLIAPAQEVAMVKHNRAAASRMSCARRVEVVARQADQLDRVANLASEWFKTHLNPAQL